MFARFCSEKVSRIFWALTSRHETDTESQNSGNGVAEWPSLTRCDLQQRPGPCRLAKVLDVK